MALYLHAAGGSVRVNASGFGAQVIESLAIPPEDQKYVASGDDLIYDFSSAAGDCLELSGSQALNCEQIGYDLFVSHFQGTVMLMNIVYGIYFFAESPINRV